VRNAPELNPKIKTETVISMLKSVQLPERIGFFTHRWIYFDHIVTVTMRSSRTLKTGIAAQFARVSTRRALVELSDEALRDIGLTRAEARHQAGLPWWR
jgi:uncharacterized protein YjiS (DUF1127 family)